MKGLVIASSLAILSSLTACSSSSGGGSPSGPADAAGTNDAEQDSSNPDDATSANDAQPDSGSVDSATTQDSGETADSAAPDGGGMDASCPASWWVAPVVNSVIEVPLDGGGVLLHAAGAGTQNYACTITDAGTIWSLTGPAATLSDCNGTLIGHHFASEAGANYPEWQTTDGTYVVGDKIGHFTPDGGAESVPWLLLQEVSTSGSGTLSQVAYVQRLFTDGGVAPGPGCDAGDTLQVPYGADYYFYGP
jgi:hypothetical protein